MITRYGVEERNLSRLNPILGLNRVNSEMTGWHKIVDLAELGTVELICDAGTGVVPHGIDADVMFALITAYELQGRPVDNTVRLTLSELCDYAGLTPGGITYKNIHSSLDRLYGVKYKAESCWVNLNKSKKKWETLVFHLIDQYSAKDETEGEAKLFTTTTTLEVSIGRSLANSINSGFSRKIDLDFYKLLRQPLARLLYRNLEEVKSENRAQTFLVPIMSWGEHLGLREVDPDSPKKNIPKTRTLEAKLIRRALEPAHNDLINRRYLKDVTYIGRGSKQSILYTFSLEEEVSKPVDLELVGILTSRGVSLGRAQELVRTTPTTTIMQSAKLFDQRIAEGFRPRNRGGVMADLLTHPEKYQKVEEIPAAVIARPLTRAQEVVESLAEPAQPPRSKQQVEAVLSNVLEQTTADRELRERLIAQFVEGRHSIMDFITLARLSDTEARAKAAELLSL